MLCTAQTLLSKLSLTKFGDANSAPVAPLSCRNLTMFLLMLRDVRNATNSEELMSLTAFVIVEELAFVGDENDDGLLLFMPRTAPCVGVGTCVKTTRSTCCGMLTLLNL